MNVHISYRSRKTPDVEKEINHLVDKLRRRLQVFRPELVHLKGIVEPNAPRGTVVSLNLRLPSGPIAVQESAATAAAAVRAAFADLLQQIGKHKELLRSSHKWQRRRVADFQSATRIPFEETLTSVPAPVVSSDDVRSYVNANLGRLERFVERELYFREAAEEIVVDSVTQGEVIDEAIVRALSNDAEKPDSLALEGWLYRLALCAIADLSVSATQFSAVHLEESARKPNVRASYEPQLQFHQPDETLTRESVIADRRTATPEDIAYSDEVVELIELALAGVGRTHREAFILHVMEGFSVDEIAAITDRTPHEVKLCIESARAQLRRSPVFATRSASGPALPKVTAMSFRR
jgi:RNA polymerase sigma factor (sigma-70 family)